jgi:predicted DNA binding protein
MVQNLDEIHKTTTIISTQVNFSVPKQRWLGTYSKKYPQLQFEILSLLSISKDQGNCLLHIKGSKVISFYKEFSKEFDSKKYQLILEEKGELLMNIIFDSPWVIWSIVEPQVIILYPIKIKDGKIMIELIAPIRKLEEIFRKPIWKPLNLKFTVAKKYCGAPSLNKHQKHILDKSIQYGLFDIPRKTSLTKAVKVLEKETGKKISVSALSENIRRITKKLADCYLNCRDTEDVELDLLVQLNKKE